MSQGENTVIGLLTKIAVGGGASAGLRHDPDPNKDPHSSWREEVLIVSCVGQGTFSQDLKFINLQMHMYDLLGKWVGFQLGVHESESTLEDLLAVPPPPSGPTVLDVPHPEVKEWTKGVWTFADGSAVYAAGQAKSHLVPLSDGSALFMVTTGQVITSGTGRYAGCHGIKEATGSTLVPRELLAGQKFPAPGLKFEARTMEVFRILKAADLQPDQPDAGNGPPPAAAPPQASGAGQQQQRRAQRGGGPRQRPPRSPGA
jgi:hypothetical protein